MNPCLNICLLNIPDLNLRSLIKLSRANLYPMKYKRIISGVLFLYFAALEI